MDPAEAVVSIDNRRTHYSGLAFSSIFTALRVSLPIACRGGDLALRRNIREMIISETAFLSSDVLVLNLQLLHSAGFVSLLIRNGAY